MSVLDGPRVARPLGRQAGGGGNQRRASNSGNPGQASAALGAAGITLLGHRDGRPVARSPGGLTDHVAALATRHLDFQITVGRACRREAAWLQASQIALTAVLWRRLEL